MLSAKERKQLWFLASLNALISLADIASLALLLVVINTYTHNTVPTHTFLPHWMYDNNSVWPVLTCLAFFGLKNFAGYFIYRAQSAYSHHVAARVSREQLLQYLNGSYSDYVSVDASVRVHRINHEPIEFAQFVLSGIQQIYSEALLALIAITAMLLYNARLFVLLVIFLVPPVMLVSYFNKKKLRNVRKQIKSDSEKITQYLQESLNGYVEGNIYNRKSFFAGRHSHYQERLNGHLATLHTTQWVPSKVVEIFAVIGLFILILVNKYTGNSAADIVSLGAFMAAAYKIIPGIVRIANLVAQVKTYEYTVKDLQPAAVVQQEMQAEDIEPVTAVDFHKVSFCHPGNSVLENFDLHIQRGDFVDIVAPSGKGKTTLLHLLLGFLSPDSGEIKINGKPADAQRLQQFWQRIGYVKQQAFLIHDSIRRNITLEEHTQNEERFRAAIHAAGLDSFINSFPEGAEKVISDSGKNISGGQRKRIALARVLYKDADVIVLDEPFSELDEAAEHVLLAYFRELAQKGKIIILITHNRISEAYCNKTVLLHAHRKKDIGAAEPGL